MKVGLVPMSAKPYHKGHHYLVKVAAEQNDVVMLFVSTSDRCRKGEVPIYGADMKEIWCNQLELLLPLNVNVTYGGSPIRKVFDVLVQEEENYNLGDTVSNIYTVYSDEEDTRLNYTVGRSKSPGALSPVDRYFPNIYLNGYVKFAAIENPELFTRGLGAPNISGTAMRNRLLDPDAKGEFIDDLPEELSDDSKMNIYKRLRKRISESATIDYAIMEAISKSRKKRPEKGSLAYSEYLDEIMDELQHIKSSYESRRKTGARYRKEASKIQDAYSEIRRLKRKNDKILNAANQLNEFYNTRGCKYKIEVTSEDKFDRDALKSFFRKIN